MTRHLTPVLAAFLFVFLAMTAAVGIGLASVERTPVVTHPAPIATTVIAAPASSAPVTADQLHDPAIQPVEAWDDAKAARKLGWPVALLAALIMLSRGIGTAGRNVPWLGWLNKGRAAVIVAGVGTVATAGFNAVGLGGTWFAVLMAAAAAFFALIPPTSGPAPAPSSLARSAASQVSLLVVAALAIGAAALAPACATLRPAGAAGVGTFMDCEGKHIDAGLLAEAKALSKSAVQRWMTGDGHIDATGLRAEAAPLRSDLMRCAFDAAIAALTVVIAPRTDTPALAAPLEVDVAELRTTWAEVRVELGWAPPAPSSSGS